VPLIGVYRGVVSSSSDPQNAGRVQVQVPSVGVTSTWALVCTQPGGVSTPYSVGSNVIVAFENGDSNRPVVLGRV
jgi:uncharacterized protein involved in type VI secretion and phage assembly